MSPLPIFLPLLNFPTFSKVVEFWNWTRYGLQKLSPLYVPKADNLHTITEKRKLLTWAIKIITEINVEHLVVCNYKYAPWLSRETLVSSCNSGLFKQMDCRPRAFSEPNDFAMQKKSVSSQVFKYYSS